MEKTTNNENDKKSYINKKTKKNTYQKNKKNIH